MRHAVAWLHPLVLPQSIHMDGRNRTERSAIANNLRKLGGSAPYFGRLCWNFYSKKPTWRAAPDSPMNQLLYLIRHYLLACSSKLSLKKTVQRVETKQAGEMKPMCPRFPIRPSRLGSTASLGFTPSISLFFHSSILSAFSEDPTDPTGSLRRWHRDSNPRWTPVAPWRRTSGGSCPSCSWA